MAFILANIVPILDTVEIYHFILSCSNPTIAFYLGKFREPEGASQNSVVELFRVPFPAETMDKELFRVPFPVKTLDVEPYNVYFIQKHWTMSCLDLYFLQKHWMNTVAASISIFFR